MTMPRIIPLWMGDGDALTRPLSLPVDLLPAGETLFRLLSACGVDRETASACGAAPAYDRWEAVCRCLPLLSGHPVYRRLHRLVAAAGFAGVLNGDTAAESWRVLSDRMADGAGVTVQSLAAEVCPGLILPVRPGQVPVGRPDVIDLNGLTAALKRALTAEGAVVCCLPDEYVFVRPNPFRAALLTRKAASGGRFSWDALPPQERDHLLTQLIRIAGGLCREAGRVLCLAGRSGGMELLLPYLSESGCLPDTVRLLTDPADGTDALPPAPDVRASVTTGVWLEGDDTSAALRRRLSDYAARMPLGAADGLYAAVRSPYGLTAAAEAERALTELFRSWAEGGDGAEI